MSYGRTVNGTPWHVGNPDKKKDPGRCKSKCKHNKYPKTGICFCSGCPYEGNKCPSTVHCDYYEEKEE
jgi:hypothetical protein